MKPLDAVKMGLLVLAILIWFVGYRAQSHLLMLSAMGIVLVAFALRFLKAPPAPPAR